MQLLVKIVRENINVLDLTCHSLRLTFKTGLSNKLINDRVIQKLARHSRLDISKFISKLTMKS